MSPTRTLLGVDVVGSARIPGYHAEEIPAAIAELLDTALTTAEISRDEVLSWDSTGDGALLTLPGSLLGSVLDAAAKLESAAIRRNQRRKPEILLRVAVESGPVHGGAYYERSKVTLTRMLDADAFKQLFGRCRAERGIATALIVSDHAKKVAFSGDHVRELQEDEFVPLHVGNKEHDETAWVRVPGCDPGLVQRFLPGPDGSAPDDRPTHPGDARDDGRAGGAAAESPQPDGSPQPSVQNVINGSSRKSFQGGVINGDITFH
ncbi:hypothetical protein ABZ805_07555 [Saccharopolyspora sp. NPDC047091]|uniref:hypothetical protein n=1 Tax=Saccharopolyspora sp. NPDC047091 TaxID=3155924 RepID=UPI0033CFE30A